MDISTLTPSVMQFAVWITANPLPGRHRKGSENTISGYIHDVAAFARWFAAD